MPDPARFTKHVHFTTRHKTTWIESGPSDGPLIVFLHGWPELGLIWHRQLEHFARFGWRAAAPDMRGYGGSSVPTDISSYTIREIVTDMVEFHDALGGPPAIWVGHDWGAPIAWSMASHHHHRCRGVVGLSVPYMARGNALANLTRLVDRSIYPEARYPIGQWDYWLFYREHFSRAAAQMEADVARTFSALYKPSQKNSIGKPAMTADVRARGGWFGNAPLPPADPSSTILTEDEFSALVAAFTATGFSGANAWYMNDTANMNFADEAPDFGRISRPALFLHGEWDAVCQTVRGHLADPMRGDCADLMEQVIPAGHMLMVEQPDAVNGAIERWLSEKHLICA
jgi:pimeloyl-ACP methyl ester carboxylesterase